MFNKIILVSGLSAVLLVASGTGFAAEQDRDQIYGSGMMTNQERAEYRSQMQAASSAEERMQIRNEHHKQMQARAKERGINIPDEPPAMRQRQDGMGSGSKCGSGGMGGGKR